MLTVQQAVFTVESLIGKVQQQKCLLLAGETLDRVLSTT